MAALSVIQEFAGRIIEEFNPERIILFGSYANGTPKTTWLYEHYA